MAETIASNIHPQAENDSSGLKGIRRPSIPLNSFLF